MSTQRITMHAPAPVQHRMLQQHRWYLVLAFHAAPGCSLPFVSHRYLKAASKIATTLAAPAVLHRNFDPNVWQKVLRDVNERIDEIVLKAHAVYDTSPQQARIAYTARCQHSHIVAVYRITGGQF